MNDVLKEEKKIVTDKDHISQGTSGATISNLMSLTLLSEWCVFKKMLKLAYKQRLQNPKNKIIYYII